MKGNLYFVYTGNAYPHKNLKRAIEAVIHLNKNSDQVVKLRISSSRNIFTQRLQKYIQKANAGSYVELLGFTDDEKLNELLKEAVGLIFPSLSEGFGLPGIEAMRAGTLVLASDIPVFKEVYLNHAIYFNPLDFSSIERTMKNAIELSEDERSEKISDAKKFVERYSWSKMAKETLKVYESCNSL